jgi:hypothetical protein
VKPLAWSAVTPAVRMLGPFCATTLRARCGRRVCFGGACVCVCLRVRVFVRVCVSRGVCVEMFVGVGVCLFLCAESSEA